MFMLSGNLLKFVYPGEKREGKIDDRQTLPEMQSAETEAQDFERRHHRDRCLPLVSGRLV